MYSEKVIEARMAQAESYLGVKLVRYDIDECHNWLEHLAKIRDPDTDDPPRS